MTLACLAVRLGVDFQATEWALRAKEREQVERHMRLCLSASPGFEHMVTVAPSEPLLAEAAMTVMTNAKMRTAAVLLEHIDGSFISAGEHGELIVAMLLLLARDTVTALQSFPIVPEISIPKPILAHDGYKRIISLCSFLTALFKKDARDILSHKPTDYRTLEEKNVSLEECFKDTYIWFNHAIKVHDFSVVNREFLLFCMARGAIIVCSDGQRGIDILIPKLTGREFIAVNASGILIQIKNNLAFKDHILAHIFESMNPFNVGLFSRDMDPESLRPIIRIVFSMASSDSGVILRPQATRASKRTNGGNANFTSYDFWCAGVDHKTFAVIDPGEDETYKQLLRRTQNTADPYQARGLADDDAVALRRVEIRRQMHPCVGKHTAHHTMFIGEQIGDLQDTTECLEDEDL